MKIFSDDLLLLNFVSVIISFTLSIYSLSLITGFHFPDNFFEYPTQNSGFLYAYQNLIAGSLAILSAIAILLNTYLQHILKRKTAKDFVHQYIDYIHERAKHKRSVLKDMEDENEIRQACADFKSIVIADQFIKNIQYLKPRQQMICLRLLDRIRGLRSESKEILTRSSTEDIDVTQSKRFLNMYLTDIVEISKIYINPEKFSFEEAKETQNWLEGVSLNE